MNNYKPLVWAGTATLVLMSVFLLVNTDKILNTATNTNTVSFSGEGRILAKPDIASVNLTILTENATSKAAQDDNSKKSKAVIEFLKKQGVDEKDIKTVGYNIYPKYSYSKPLSNLDYQESDPKIIGYQVNENIEVKIRNLEKISVILDGVVSAGVNQVNNLQFGIDDKEKLKAEAREKAITDAKKKANELEDQVDVNLGKIVNYSEGFVGWPAPIYYALDKVEGNRDDSVGPEISTGQNEVVVNVTITYQIK